MSKKITVKPPILQNDGNITKKEKADLKKIAKHVADAHKGSEKPQLLQAIKGEEKVTLCTIPVVRWQLCSDTLDDAGRVQLKNIRIKRIVESFNLQMTAAKAKAIKDKHHNDMGKVIDEVIKKDSHQWVKLNWFASDDDALYHTRKNILNRIERCALDLSYGLDADSDDVIIESAALIRTLREFEASLRYYKLAVDEEFRILPDMKKFTVKDRKFVPIEKPQVPKKTPAKK